MSIRVQMGHAPPCVLYVKEEGQSRRSARAPGSGLSLLLSPAFSHWPRRDALAFSAPAMASHSVPRAQFGDRSPSPPSTGNDDIDDRSTFLARDITQEISDISSYVVQYGGPSDIHTGHWCEQDAAPVKVRATTRKSS